MADTTFNDRVTVIATEWLNEVNNLVHTIFSDPSSAAEARTALGAGDASGPASSVDDNVVTFDGTGGKTIQDSGVAISDIASTAASQAEMEAGTETAIRTMSPLRVQQAIDVAVPSGSKRILDIGQEITTNTYTSTSISTVGTRSDEVSVTPKTANSKLFVTASVATYTIQTSSGTSGNATTGGYNNSSELSVQIGNPIGTGQNVTGSNSQNSEINVSFVLDQTMLDSSGDWTFKLMGYLSNGNQANWYAATFNWIEYEDVT